jgi:hypothetical protein
LFQAQQLVQQCRCQFMPLCYSLITCSHRCRIWRDSHLSNHDYRCNHDYPFNPILRKMMNAEACSKRSGPALMYWMTMSEQSSQSHSFLACRHLVQFLTSLQNYDIPMMAKRMTCDQKWFSSSVLWVELGVNMQILSTK